MANIGTLTAHIGADTSMLRGNAAQAKKMFRGMATSAKVAATDVGRSFDIIRATTLGVAPAIAASGVAISNFTPYMAAMGAAAKSAAIPIGYVKSKTSELIVPTKLAGKAIGDTAKSVKSASSRMSELGSSVKSSLKPMLALIGLTGGIVVLAKAFSKLAEATKLAARIEVMNHVLEMTGEAAGYTESELKKYRNQIRGLGIATKEAIGIEQLFIQSKLKVADALKISRAAQNLATIAGTNSSEAAKTLTQAIVAQRPILLKQFGIIASLDKIYNQMAKSLGKTRSELTETEKRQGFMNEILAQSATLAGAYETAMRDVGKQITSLPRYYADAAAALGEHFLPQMEFSVGAAKDLAKEVTKMFRSVEDATGVFYASRDAFETNARSTKTLADEYDDLKKKGKLSTEQQGELKTIIERITAIMPAAADQWDEANRVIGINTDRLRENIEQQRAMFRLKSQDQIKSWKEEWEKLNDELATFATAKIFTEQLVVKKLDAAGIAGFIANVVSGKPVMESFNYSIVDVNEKLADTHGKMNDLTIALSQGYDAINDYARVQRDFAEYPGLAEGIRKLQLAEQEAAKLRDANVEVAGSVDEITKSYAELQANINRAGSRVSNMRIAGGMQMSEAGFGKPGEVGSVKLAGDVTGQLIANMSQGMDEMGQEMTRWAQDTANAMQNAFGHTFFDWMEGRVMGLRGILEGITKDILSMMNRIIAQRAAEKIIGAMFSSGGMPLPTFPVPELAAAGGMVTRPTLAMVGEAGPEMIIPLEKLRDQKFWSELTDGSGQGDTSIVVNVQTPSPSAFQDSQSLIATQLAGAVQAARRNM
jgi:hypothetical protein